MKEWFKARNIWGAAITALSDAEAGRVAKAIWAYTMDGEIVEIEGAGKGILAMILMTLGQDEERDSDISAKRANAAKAMHLQANASKSMQMQANADKCKQAVATDSICSNKNKNKNIEKEQESESYITDADARAIQSEQNRVLDAAEDAGFKISNSVIANLTALYADYGLDRMLDGIKSCAEHGVANLAYLRAVLNGKPKQAKPKVIAQDFEQRDYSKVEDEMMSELAKEMAAFKKEGA